MPETLRITVLGSGTSSGVPTIGCSCATCASADPRDNRLRPSVLVQYGGKNVLIDTTPDFRAQALRAAPNDPNEQERLFKQFLEWSKRQSRQ